MSKTELAFANQKRTAVSGHDLSRKGSVDEPIQDLVAFINSMPQYFTTSSCSGRILLFADIPSETPTIHKEGCKWVHVSHNCCTPEEISSKADPTCGDLTFKFEAFVLHVQCRSLDDAQLLLSCGIQAGFRNSGISLKSRKKTQQDWPKIIVGIRSTHGIEAPLSAEGKMLVSTEYIEYLTVKANNLMEENLRRIERFHKNFTMALSSSKEPSP